MSSLRWISFRNRVGGQSTTQLLLCDCGTEMVVHREQRYNLLCRCGREYDPYGKFLSKTISVSDALTEIPWIGGKDAR